MKTIIKQSIYLLLFLLAHSATSSALSPDKQLKATDNLTSKMTEAHAELSGVRMSQIFYGPLSMSGATKEDLKDPLIKLAKDWSFLTKKYITPEVVKPSVANFLSSLPTEERDKIIKIFLNPEADIEMLGKENFKELNKICLLYTSPSPRDKRQSRMPSSA